MQTNKMPATNLYCIVARAQIIVRTSALARPDRQTSRQRRDQISRQHREYLKRVMKLTGKKATPLAEAAGLSPSTLSRVLKEGGTGMLSANTLSKLQDHSGIPLHFGGETSGPWGPRGLAEEAVPFDSESADPAVSAAITALIGSRADAVPWTIRTRALECMGYLPGDIVIVELGRRPQQGDVVWAEVYNLGRSDGEMVMRIYRPPILAVASLDQQLGGPLMVDDARVIIRGVVLPHRLRPSGPTALIG
jgi:transcriptional regulator with XRE-family HTH domain